MKGLRAGLVMLMVSGILNSACARHGSHSSPGQAGSTPSPSASSTAAPRGWATLTERTACGAIQPDNCLGAYGFRVFSNSSLVAGPPPGGGIVSGMIWGRELETLDQDVARLSATDLSSPLVCQSPQVLPGVQDRVVLNDGQQRDFVIFEGSSAALHGSDCTAGDPVKAEKLHADLHALMKEYYPVPFPRGGVVKAGPAPGSS